MVRCPRCEAELSVLPTAEQAWVLCVFCEQAVYYEDIQDELRDAQVLGDPTVWDEGGEYLYMATDGLAPDEALKRLGDYLRHIESGDVVRTEKRARTIMLDDCTPLRAYVDAMGILWLAALFKDSEASDKRRTPVYRFRRIDVPLDDPWLWQDNTYPV